LELTNCEVRPRSLHLVQQVTGAHSQDGQGAQLPGPGGGRLLVGHPDDRERAHAERRHQQPGGNLGADPRVTP
jgi:hypothetical protein